MGHVGRDRGAKPVHPTTSRHIDLGGVHVSLYAPWWAVGRDKSELGGMIRVRDPRPQCFHHCPPVWHDLKRTTASCSRCASPLQVEDKKIIQSHRQPRWRWVKLFVARTRSPSKSRHNVYVAEAETHLTEGVSSRLSVKAFFRVKFGLGGRYV